MNTAQTIVAASLWVFYRHGFHASGVDLLSQEAGVTKKTLYRYYPSKDALIAAALALRHEQFMTKVRAYVDAAPSPQQPLAYIDFVISWVQEEGFYGCAFINATAEFADLDTSPHRQAAQHKQDLQAYLRGLCLSSGVSHPELMAEQLFIIGEGLVVASQVQGYDAGRMSAARQLAQAVWQAAQE